MPNEKPYCEATVTAKIIWCRGNCTLYEIDAGNGNTVTFTGMKGEKPRLSETRHIDLETGDERVILMSRNRIPPVRESLR